MRDSFGREFPGSKGLDKDYLMMSGPKKPWQAPVPQDEESKNKFESENKRLEQMKDFTKQLVEKASDIIELLQPLISRDETHVKTVVEKKEELDTPKKQAMTDNRPTFANLGMGTRDYGSVLGQMQTDMERSQTDIGRFTAAALHKGSLYTHDIHMFQQSVITNRLLLAILNQSNNGKVPIAIDNIPKVDSITNTWSLISSDSKSLAEQLGKMTQLEYQINTGGPHLPVNRPTVQQPGMPPIIVPTMEVQLPPMNTPTEALTQAATAGAQAAVSNAPTPKPTTHNHHHDHSNDGGGPQKTHLRDLALVHGGDSGFVGPLDQLMWKFQHFRGRAMADAVKKLSGGLVGVSAFTPMALDIAETVKYQQSIRQIAYQTEGITREMSVQQNMFMARNDLLATTMATGQKLADVEKAYVRNLQSGYKSAKDTLKVTRAGLSAATMIGTNAEETSAVFHDMYMTLSLSANQMDQIARGVASTARNSKMTGENLLKAVQGAKPLMDAMKKSGTLSSASATGAIGLTAEFQKLGISDTLAPVLKSFTSLSDWMNADEKTRSVAGILTGGNTNRFIGGNVFKDKALQRDMADNADQFMRMFGFDSKTIGQASTRDKENANMASQQVLGMGINELAETANTFRKMSQTLAENLVDIDKKINATSMNDTTQRAALINQKEGLRQESRLTVATNLGEIMGKSPGRSVTDALTSARGEDFAPIMEDLRQLMMGDQFRFAKAGVTQDNLSSAEGMQRALALTYSDAIERTNLQLLNNGTSVDDNLIIRDVNKTLQEAMEDKTGSKMTNLLGRMSEAQQAASKRELKQTDPVVAALDTLNSINGQISMGIGKSVTLLTGILGEVGILSLAFGAMSADAVVAFGGMFRHGRGGRATARRAGPMDDLVTDRLRQRASKNAFRDATKAGMDEAAAQAMAAAAAGAVHGPNHALFGKNSLEWGQGSLTEKIKTAPGRMKASSMRWKDRMGENMGKVGGELVSVLEAITPGGSAPGRFVGGAARGVKSGLGSFGRGLGNVAMQAPTLPLRTVQMMGKLVPKAIKSPFNSVFGALPDTLTSFFHTKLPGLVRSAFDPKMMRGRIMAGFDVMVGNAGPFKILRDKMAASFGDAGLMSRGVTAAGAWFRDPNSLGGKFSTRAGQATAAAKDRVNKTGAFLANTALAQGIGSRIGNLRDKASGVGGSVSKFMGGKMSGGEAVFRMARAQEKIPLWGKFASMFGAGAQVASATGGLSAISGTMGATAAGTAGASAGAGAIGSVAAAALLPVVVFTTAMLSMKQGLDSAAAATKLFALEDEKLTGAHVKAAESAGFVTGILNTLTFGVFSDWIGATGSVTSSLAMFLYQWKFLNSAIQAIMVPVKIVYGILTGLWEFTKEVFGGIMEGIMAAVAPLGEAFTYLQDSMSGVWKDLTSAFKPISDALAPFLGQISESASIIGTITWALKGLGQGVGFIFKALGMGLGLLVKLIVPLIKVVIDVFTTIVKTVITILTPLVEGVARIFTGVMNFVGGVVDIFKGIFSGDNDVILEGMGKIYTGVEGILGGLTQFVLQSFLGLFMAIPSLLLNALGTLGTSISKWGKSIGRMLGSWPEKFFTYITKPFEWLGNFFNKIGGIASSVGGLVTKLSKGDFSGFWKEITDNFPSALADGLYKIPGQMTELFMNMFSAINEWMDQNIPLFKKGKDALSAVVEAPAKAVQGIMANTTEVRKEQGVVAAGQVAVGNTILGVESLASAAAKGTYDWAKWLYNGATGLMGFAEGGVVTSPGLAMVGEAGPEMIIPVKALAAQGAQGTNNVPGFNTVARPDTATFEPRFGMEITNAQAVENAMNRGTERLCLILEKEHSHIRGYGDKDPRYTINPSQMTPMEYMRHVQDPMFRHSMGDGRGALDYVHKKVNEGRDATMRAVPNKNQITSLSRAAILTNNRPINAADQMKAEQAARAVYVETPVERERRIALIAKGTTATGAITPSKEERSINIGEYVKSLSPRQLMKERGGVEVTDTTPVSKSYPPGWGEKMVRGSLVVVNDPQAFPIVPETVSPPVPMSVEDFMGITPVNPLFSPMGPDKKMLPRFDMPMPPPEITPDLDMTPTASITAMARGAAFEMPAPQITLDDNLVPNRFSQWVDRSALTHEDAMSSIRARESVLQKRAHEEALGATIPIPSKDERLGSIQASVAAEHLRWPTTMPTPTHEEHMREIRARHGLGNVIPVGEPKVSETIPMDVKIPAVPGTPGYGVDVPLIRPEAGRLIDDVGNQITRLANLQSMTVGERASTVQDSRTVGVSPVGSFSNLLDEDGMIRNTDAVRSRLEPIPLQDIHERIQQDMATSQPEIAEVSSPALEATADNTNTMVDVMNKVLGGIQELVQLLKPTGNPSGNSNARTGTTRSNLSAQRSPQYHQLSFGQYSDSAVKGVVNDGV